MLARGEEKEHGVIAGEFGGEATILQAADNQGSPARTCHSHESGERPWMVTSRNFAGWYFSILRICAACRSFSRSDLEIQYRTEMTLVVTVLVGTHMAIGPYR